ncbi:hypothetical protein [Robiginitalea sediminis]|uniref:hypothetical protein n=1 Tax=Robiginitalea sediminis TaxID=1982593 RepID=UPI000B4B0778|nr:hypothetical protein [Robiginitalea sediminis]
MKRIYLLLLAPLLMSTQCESEEEPVFRTEYFIENNTSTDLAIVLEEAGEVVIASQSSQFIAVASDFNGFVPPSENIAFSSITLYRTETGGYEVVAYQQEPILDELWRLESEYEYDAAYILTLTDADLE